MREIRDAVKDVARSWREPEKQGPSISPTDERDCFDTGTQANVFSTHGNGNVEGLRQRRAERGEGAKGYYQLIPVLSENDVPWTWKPTYLGPLKECESALATGEAGVESVFERLCHAWINRTRSKHEHYTEEARLHEALACLDALIASGNLLERKGQPVDAYLWKAVALEALQASPEHVIEAYDKSGNVKRGPNWGWIREILALKGDYLDRVGRHKEARSTRQAAFDTYQGMTFLGRLYPQTEKYVQLDPPCSNGQAARANFYCNKLNILYYLDVHAIDPDLKHIVPAASHLSLIN